MANPEHLAILKKGVKAWNKWREENPTIRPDLNRANFDKANLEGANFREVKLGSTRFYKANLNRTDFSEVDLQGTDLRGASLKNANLEKADLRMKSLFGIDFRGANLKEANLTNAQFLETNLGGANLHKTNFSRVDFRNLSFQGCNLSEAIFRESDLSGTSLRESNLRGANFTSAKLNRADLFKANLENAILRDAEVLEANLSSSSCLGAEFIAAKLSGADMSNAMLSRADFRAAFLLKTNFSGSTIRDANLGMANLTMANLRGADLTGSCLFSTSRDGWEIDGLLCEFIFWDNEWIKKTPKDKNFLPGEFEELYKHLPTIEYYFEHGFTPIDAVIMNRVVQAINQRLPRIDLKLDSFHSRGQPHAVFTVQHKEDAEEALNQVKIEFETRIAKVEGERDAVEKCFNRVIGQPQIYIEHLKNVEKEETYNLSWNQVSRDVDLTRLSEELSVLREAIKREAKLSEDYRALAEVSDAEAAAKTGNGSKVIEHLKKAGKWTFDVARDIGTDVAAEVIKKSIGL